MSAPKTGGGGIQSELPARYHGVETCEAYGDSKICVRGAKYGFSGWLQSKSGANVLPLITAHHPRDPKKPIIQAMTPKQALKNARAFLRRVKKGNRR